MRLCASITRMLVGSPTMMARGRGRSAPSRAISGRTPVQPTSSSYETMMWIGSFSLRALNNDVLTRLYFPGRKQPDVIAAILDMLEHHYRIRADGYRRARHNLPYGATR